MSVFITCWWKLFLYRYKYNKKMKLMQINLMTYNFQPVDVELHPHGIATIFLKIVKKSFCMHKTHFFLQFPSYMWFIPLVEIIGKKPTPGDHESNIKKVVAIPCGCNTKWTFSTMSWMALFNNIQFMKIILVHPNVKLL